MDEERLREAERERDYVLAAARWDSFICRGLVETTLPELVAEVRRLRVALRRTESRLSLLRHRGGIRWGGPGIGDASEYDEVIGEARRLLEHAGSEQAR